MDENMVLLHIVSEHLSKMYIERRLRINNYRKVHHYFYTEFASAQHCLVGGTHFSQC